MMWAHNEEDLEVTVATKAGDTTSFYQNIEEIAKRVGGLYLGHSELRMSEDEPPFAYEISFAFLTPLDRVMFVGAVRKQYPDKEEVTIHGVA